MKKNNRLERTLKTMFTEFAEAFGSLKRKGNSRNPERIPVLLKRLQVVWEKNPDLRLGQIVANAAYQNRKEYDSFYIEDEALISTIERQNKNRRSDK